MPVLRHLLTSVVFVLCASPMISIAQQAPVEAVALGGRSALPNYDIRLDDAPTRSRILHMKKSGVYAGRQSASNKLIRRTPGLAIDLNEAMATPDFVRSTTSFLTRAAVQGPVDTKQVVIDYVAANGDLFGVAPAQLAAARITRDAVTAHNGVRTLWFQQEIEGVPVVGADLRANILPDGRLATIGSRMLPLGPLNSARAKARNVSPQRAAQLAAQEIGVQIAANLQIIQQKNDRQQGIVFAKTPLLSQNILTERVYFPVGFDDVRPAFRVVLGAAGDSNTYEVYLDAADGSMLERINNTWRVAPGSGTYRVWTSDSPAPMTPGPATPNGVQAPVIARTLITPTVDPVASPSGWINAGLNETLGNNVDAHTDINNDDIPDLPRPAGSPPLVFDFPIDLASAPATYRDGSVVQGFYTSNWYHDLIYALGFTEGFGNFQTNNFGRGGVGTDPISLDVHDGAGFNNANFNSTGADGDFARVQMFLFDGPIPARDGNLDGHILVHELTHGTSIRLHGGLGSAQGAGMGEGWSDFYALSMYAEPSDPINGVYPMSGYATFDVGGSSFFDNYYFGIRRFPYSTDMTVNPLTFADIDDAQFNVNPAIPRNPVIGSPTASEVHNVGEIWCAALWEGRASLITSMGFAGNQAMLQLVTDGMKLTTTSTPSMVQSRDAILMADLINNNGANVCTLWPAFAKRGLGGGASSPSSSTTGVVEDFTVPIGVNIAIDGGAPDRAQAGAIMSIPVTITENCGAPLITGSERLVFTLNGGALQSVPLLAGAGATQFIANIPALACGDVIAYHFAADTADGVFTFPANAPANDLSLIVFTSTQLSFIDDFETNLGWFIFGDAIAGQWQQGVPIGGGFRGDPPTDADGSGQCYLTENLPGNSDVDGGFTSLLSPTLDASGAGDPFVSYYLWYSNDLGTAIDDVMVIEISNDDGTTWSPLETLPVSTAGWEQRLLRVADFVTPTSTMRLRFTANDLGAGSIVEAGVDGVSIEQFMCETTIPSDFNGDGVVDAADLATLLAQWGSTGSADLNSDGVVDAADLATLLANWG